MPVQGCYAGWAVGGNVRSISTLTQAGAVVLGSVVLLGLAGCTETGLRGQSPPSGAPGSALEITPATLDFGMVAPDEQVVGQLQITARGSAVQLDQLTVELDSFALLDPPSDLLLQMDESVDVGIVFQSSDLGRLSSVVRADSDAEGGPAFATLLSQVTLLEPDVHATPQALELESGQAAGVRVSNEGQADLEVYTVELQDAPGFSLVEGFSGPQILAAREAFEVPIAYSGTGAEGRLVITSDDPDEPALIVPLVGNVGDGDCEDIDGDGDGSNLCDDCDDADPGRAPHLSEICDDDIDQDCDGKDAKGIVLALLPGWGGGSGDGSLIWPSFEADWSSHGTCPVSLVDIAPGFTVETLTDSGATSIVITDPGGAPIEYTADEKAAVRAYAQDGHGGVIVTYLLSWDGWDHSDMWDNSDLADLVGVRPLALDTAHAESVSNYVRVVDAGHPLNDGVSGGYTVTPYGYAQGRVTESWSASLLPGATIAAQADDGHMATIGYQGSTWRGVFFTGMADYQSGAPRAMYNAALWTGAE